MTIKGQVTIPQPVRKRLGLHAGSIVRFVENAAGETLVAPGVPDATDRARSDAEIATRLDAAADLWAAQRDPNNRWHTMSSDEYMAEMREPIEPFDPAGSD